MKFPQILQGLRLQKGLSKKQLADAINATDSAISNWESAKTKPSLYMVARLVKFFDTTFTEILGVEE